MGTRRGNTSGRLTWLAALTCFAMASCTSAPAAPTAVPAKPTTAATTSAAAPSPQGAAPSPATSPVAGSPVAVAAPSPSASPAAAPRASFNEQAVADFYRGKTVRLLVGFGPGGGYDIFARTIAKSISKYLPGNPTVVVENIAGAGSAVMLAQAYNQLPKDGTILATGSGGTAAEQALGTTTFEFDATKWQYIGAPDHFEYVYVFSKEALEKRGVTSFKDILGPNGKEMVVAAVTATGSDARSDQIMRAAFGAKLKIVSGYSGTAAEFLAMESGEVDGLTPPWDSARAEHLDDIKSGRMVLLAQFPEEGISDLPYDVPKVFDLAQTEEQRELIRYGILLPNEFVRTYVMAPEVPADRVNAMRTAFDKTMADPTFLADVERAGLKANPLTGEQLRGLIQEYFGIPADIKKRLQDIFAAPL